MNGRLETSEQARPRVKRLSSHKKGAIIVLVLTCSFAVSSFLQITSRYPTCSRLEIRFKMRIEGLRLLAAVGGEKAGR